MEGKTSIVIAHRFRPSDVPTSIFVVKDGIDRGIGHAPATAGIGGLYAERYKMQFRMEEGEP